MPLSKHNAQPVDPVLTQFMNDYTNLEFIGDKIFPIIPVGTESGTYYTFTGKERFLDTITRRSPGTKYHRMNLTPHSETYQTHEEGQEIPVDKRIQASALDPFDPYRYASQLVKDVVLLKRERIIMSLIANAAVFTNTAALAGADQWSDANSEPIEEVNDRKLTIRNACGRPPNTMVISWEVYLKLSQHPVMLDKVATTKTKIVTESLIAELFDLERVFISRSTYNSAEEGQTIVLAPVLSDVCWIGWVNPSPSRQAPSAGYLIQKEGFRADSYYEVQSDSDVVRARVNETAEIVSIDTAFLLTDVLA